MLDMEKARIFIRPGGTGMRKGADGLVVLVQEQMGEGPLNGSVYMFCNKGRKLLKAVWWDGTGFWLSQKRLEKRQVSLTGDGGGGTGIERGRIADAALRDRFF
jgi:transposase